MPVKFLFLDFKVFRFRNKEQYWYRSDETRAIVSWLC